ncbi:MAG: BMC domain-containing protein [Clostridia bacterium]|nr:BMC domain-containing protein [Clostridia bacterium]
MDLMNVLSQEDKMRIIQEIVPGKQITLAHIIAGPDEIIYRKLGLNPSIDYEKAAIGILTITPSETAIIAGDVAYKTANVNLEFIDRFSGTLIITGQLSDVEAALAEVLDYTKEALGFSVCGITKR